MKPSELVKELKSHAGDLVDTESYTKRLLTEAADLIEGLIPRPIEEAKIETSYLVFGGSTGQRESRLRAENNFTIASQSSNGEWICAVDFPRYSIENPTHFIPLSAIQQLMERGE